MLDTTGCAQDDACDMMLMTGRRVGRLVVRGLNRNEDVVCDCDCGETVAVDQDVWVSGARYECDSCAEYRSWSPARQIIADEDTYQALLSRARGAKDRCRNPENPNYENYGGRGIRFQYRSEEAMALDLWLKGWRAGDPRTTDRIDVDGHYEAGNVRLADAATQARNRRVSLAVDTGAGTISLADLAEQHGISTGTWEYGVLSKFASAARDRTYREVLGKIRELAGE